MKKQNNTRKCSNCGRGIYGFWKYGPNFACSRPCFQRLMAEGKIERLNPTFANKELGIGPPRKFSPV